MAAACLVQVSKQTELFACLRLVLGFRLMLRFRLVLGFRLMLGFRPVLGFRLSCLGNAQWDTHTSFVMR